MYSTVAAGAYLYVAVNIDVKNAFMLPFAIAAGGLATYLHADYVKSLLPESIKYHALADAG